MQTTPKPLLRRIDLAAALGLLTRLPVSVEFDAASARGAASAWCFPIVGALVGALAAAVAGVATALGTGPGISAGLALATLVVVTGAMHEDGLADTADGLWGGWTQERRLEIMKDSRIGAYGVLALVLSILLRWSALVTLSEGTSLWIPLITSAALSRAGMVLLWARLPPARDTGLSASSGRPTLPTGLLATAIAIGIGAILLKSLSVSVLCACVAGVGLVMLGMIAKARIGGQTGDILGASQQIADLMILIALAALLT